MFVFIFSRGGRAVFGLALTLPAPGQNPPRLSFPARFGPCFHARPFALSVSFALVRLHTYTHTPPTLPHTPTTPTLPHTIRTRKDSQGRMARTKLTEQGCQIKTARIGLAGQGQKLPGQDCQDRASKIELLGHDRQDRTVGRGHPGFCSCERVSMTGL